MYDNIYSTLVHHLNIYISIRRNIIYIYIDVSIRRNIIYIYIDVYVSIAINITLLLLFYIVLVYTV